MIAKHWVRIGQAIALWLGLQAASAHAGVELVQLTTANIDLYVTGEARGGIVAGDVIMRNDMITVAILTGSSKNDPTRSGRCIVLAASGETAKDPLGQCYPGPAIPWSRPEAGSNPNLAVIKFYRTEPSWGAELTYRLRDGVPWVEISTRLVNKSDERSLEVPIVDRIEPLSGGKWVREKEGYLATETKSEAALGYISVGREMTAEEGRPAWNVSLVSGDPDEGTFRRASMRVLTFGRAGTPLMPVEPAREWGRSIRSRESWYRVEPKGERVAVRRLVVAITKNQLASIMPIARESKPADASPASSPAPESVVMPQPETARPAASPKPVVNQTKVTTPRVASAARPAKKPAPNKANPAPNPSVVISDPEAPTKITGKLRGSATAELAEPAPIVSSITKPLPSLPAKSNGSAKSAAEKLPPKVDLPIDENDFAPTIDAIEDLPPPEE